MEKGYELTESDGKIIGHNLGLIVDSEEKRPEIFNPESTIESRVYHYNPGNGALVSLSDERFDSFPACALNFEVARDGRKGIAEIRLENGASDRVKGLILFAAELYNMKDYLVKKGAVRLGKLKYRAVCEALGAVEVA